MLRLRRKITRERWHARDDAGQFRDERKVSRLAARSDIYPALAAQIIYRILPARH
jgi:hypothetical protein